MSDTAPLILSRSLLSGVVGLVPIPFFDDLVGQAFRKDLLRRLAEIRHVDLDDSTLEILCDRPPTTGLSATQLGALALGRLRRRWRRLAASLSILRFGDDALDTFETATLFDHYCSHHHLGVGISRAEAEGLHQAFTKAKRLVARRRVENAFRFFLFAPSRLALALPRLASDWMTRISGGPKLNEPLGPLEPEKVSPTDDPSDPNPMVRAANRIGNAIEEAYVRSLIEAFENEWRARGGGSQP